MFYSHGGVLPLGVQVERRDAVHTVPLARDHGETRILEVGDEGTKPERCRARKAGECDRAPDVLGNYYYATSSMRPYSAMIAELLQSSVD
jgi:hypothetical protein